MSPCKNLALMRNGSVVSCSFSLILLSTFVAIAGGRDTLSRFTGIKDGETVVSAGGSYVLGFFSPTGNSRSRYLGIWFAVSVDTVVWVANRDKPLNNSAGVLVVDGAGNLVLINEANMTVWSSLLPGARNSVAQLLDSGNLVLKDSSGAYLWQSFDHPTDTMLAGLKLGPDYKAGLTRSLTSWRDQSDPAPGDFSFVLDARVLPQPFLYKQKTPVYRSGPWNGVGFSGTPEMESYSDMFNFTVENNQNGAYYEFGIRKPEIYARLVVNQSGVAQRLVWDGSTWKVFWFAPKDQCDNYAMCGPNSVCNTNKAPVCGCLQSFRPRYPQQWYLRDWSGGCARMTALNCSGDGFLQVPQLKLPDTVNSTVNMSMNLGECRQMCLEKCSCTAYASASINAGGSGCIMWYGDLLDIKIFLSSGQDIYVRLAGSDIASTQTGSSRRNARLVVIVLATTLPTVLLLLILICGCCMWWKNKRKPVRIEEGRRAQNTGKSAVDDEESELPLFDFATIQSATNNFSDANRIGKGGFGIVYKGTLDDGREIAVKRQSSHSLQGIDEFKTEVTLIAKLQHRNLVRLLGCCIDGEERMLIYEYMPNGSLDDFIFGLPRRRSLLNWRRRLDIILGVARGLLYLHQDSRLRIIHRDLKVANILLDGDMNPKISDFGTARIFGRDQMDDNTMRIVGTVGYMSPEYAMDGNFSEKSDVFSFGVLVMEIISGRKNRLITQKASKLNLLACAWRLWIEDCCLDLIDDTLRCPCPSSEILRCIQVGLLCVQESPDERPTMQQVVLMLANENSTLPRPRKPGFYCPDSNLVTADSPSTGQESSSFTLTTPEGR